MKLGNQFQVSSSIILVILISTPVEQLIAPGSPYCFLKLYTSYPAKNLFANYFLLMRSGLV